MKTINEVANQANVHHNTIRKQVHKGFFHATVGDKGQYLFDDTEVEVIVKHYAVSPPRDTKAKLPFPKLPAQPTTPEVVHFLDAIRDTGPHPLKKDAQ